MISYEDELTRNRVSANRRVKLIRGMSGTLLLVAALAALISLIAILTKPSAEEAGYGNLTAAELKLRLEQEHDLVRLDVRTPEEFTGPLGHLVGAILIPVQELETRIHELDEYKEQEIIVYCRSGNRSRIASEILLQHEFKATNLLGGMRAWNAMTEVPSSSNIEERESPELMQKKR